EIVKKYPNVFSERCRTNNDCESGRCEWRHCVGKLGRVISGRTETSNCYVDEDCPTKQICVSGLCQERLPLMQDMVKIRPGWLSSRNFTSSLYFLTVIVTLMHIARLDSNVVFIETCENKPAEFCKEITGLDNAICREMYFEYENVRSYVCQLPLPFQAAELKTCGENNTCARYSTCIRGTCFHPFWVTVRERCKNDSDCTFRSYCKDGGCKQKEWVLRHKACRVSTECSSDPTMKFVCRRFECTYRRAIPYELNCDGDNWFYWYSAFYCSSTTEKTYLEAVSECQKLQAELVYSPDRGVKDKFSPENALLSCKNYIFDLAVRAGWVKEGNDGVEQTFVNWKNVNERMNKSRFFCKSKLFFL
uniref:C-type lectin domain-containing protein n=1 Tax=Elaeophora elaphi TaxID=1147741 RepID=A0A0R3RJ96_9BILA